MDALKYFDIILHPQETMMADLKDADMNAAMKTFAIAGALIGLVVGIGIAIGGSALNLGILSWAAVIVAPIVLAIAVVLGAGFSLGIPYLCTKLVGGTGKFAGNYYLSSRLFWPMIFAEIILFLVALIPIVGGIIQIVWMFYTMYLYIVLLSVANNISKVKALIAYFIPMVIVLVFLFFILGSAVLGFIAAMGAAGAAPKLG